MFVGCVRARKIKKFSFLDISNDDVKYIYETLNILIISSHDEMLSPFTVTVNSYNEEVEKFYNEIYNTKLNSFNTI